MQFLKNTFFFSFERWNFHMVPDTNIHTYMKSFLNPWHHLPIYFSTLTTFTNFWCFLTAPCNFHLKNIMKPFPHRYEDNFLILFHSNIVSCGMDVLYLYCNDTRLKKCFVTWVSGSDNYISVACFYAILYPTSSVFPDSYFYFLIGVETPNMRATLLNL